MKIGAIYDQHVADTYDQDSLGLLSGGRGLGIAQILAATSVSPACIVDLGVGTGESLNLLGTHYPQAKRIGIDLSARMIEVARRKFEFTAYVDDACNAGAHVPDDSADLVMAHFLTTFVNRPKLFRTAANLLRPGGLFSVVGTPSEAFGKISAGVCALLGDAGAVQAASPTPENAQSLAAELTAAGFTIVAVESFRRTIRFESFNECMDWGLRSGFFAHTVEAIGRERLEAFAQIPGLFPLEDEYVAVAVLATKPGNV